jgi:hypothetical protein
VVRGEGLRAHVVAIAPRTLDLFVSREAAEAELAEILVDEPNSRDVLRVLPIELDESNVSAN